MSWEEQWAQPTEVTDAELSFGGGEKKLLPPYDKLPPEFKDWNTPWVRVAHHWFHRGVLGAHFSMVDDVDHDKAMRHIGAIMGSFAPKHEHKIAGIAYLMYRWFGGVIIHKDDGYYLYRNEEVRRLNEDEVSLHLPYLNKE